MSELTFPELEVAEPPRAAAMPLAPTAKAATTAALAAIDVQAVALSRFGDWRPQATALVAKYKGVLFDCTTVRGLQAATDARAEVRAPRYEAQRVSKASKSELAKVSKAIGAEEQAIIDALAATEEHIDAQIRADAERRAAEKAERERIEAARVAAHEAGIARIRGYVALAQGKSSAQIEKGLDYLGLMEIGDSWEDFADQARLALAETREILRDLRDAALTKEAAAAAAEARRIEQLRVAEQQRAEAARLKAEADKLANERAEFEEARRQAEALAESNRLEALAIENRARIAAQRIADDALSTPVERQEPVVAAKEPDVLPAVYKPKPEPDTRPPISTGDISRRLGFTLTSWFVLATLNIPSTPTTSKTGVYWREAQWDAIKAALVDHIEELA